MPVSAVNQEVDHVIGERVVRGNLRVDPVGEHQERAHRADPRARAGRKRSGRAKGSVVSSNRNGPCMAGP